eukprot:scaffold19643_cov60-Phaeocystis_antarctica.AAC.1
MPLCVPRRVPRDVGGPAQREQWQRDQQQHEQAEACARGPRPAQRAPERTARHGATLGEIAAAPAALEGVARARAAAGPRPPVTVRVEGAWRRRAGEPGDGECNLALGRRREAQAEVVALLVLERLQRDGELAQQLVLGGEGGWG